MSDYSPISAQETLSGSDDFEAGAGPVGTPTDTTDARGQARQALRTAKDKAAAAAARARVAVPPQARRAGQAVGRNPKTAAAIAALIVAATAAATVMTTRRRAAKGRAVRRRWPRLIGR